MTDFTDPQSAGIRLSNADRDEAVAQLNANLRDGRLNDAEFTERSSTVRSAVTYGDLAPLFSDLPRATTPPPAFDDGQQPGAPSFGPGSSAYATPPASYAGSDALRQGPIGGRAGIIAVSIAPIVALILFFIFGVTVGYQYSWLWFLLIPIVGVVVYGGGIRDRRR